MSPSQRYNDVRRGREDLLAALFAARLRSADVDLVPPDLSPPGLAIGLGNQLLRPVSGTGRPILGR